MTDVRTRLARAAEIPAATGVAGRLIRGGAATFLANMAGMGLGFALQLALAHWLSAEGFGVYAYVWAWLNLLAWAAVMGHDVLVLREVAALRATGAWPLLLGLRRHVRLVVGTAALMLALGGSVVVAAVDPPAELNRTFMTAFVALVPMALLRLHAGLLCGAGLVLRGLVPERVGRDAAVLCMIGAAALAGTGADPALAMAFMTAAILAALAAATAMEPATIRGAAPGTRPESRRRVWIGSAVAMGTIAGTQIVLHRVDVLMLGAIDGVAHVGIYSVAVVLAELVLFTQNAIGQLFGSMLSTHHARGETAEMTQVIRTATRLGAAGGAAAAILLGLLAPWILSLFGAGFDAGATALRILAAGLLLRCIHGPVALLLTMTGHERDTASVFAAAGVANIVLNALLIPPLGMEGAALSTSLAGIGAAVAMAVLVGRRVGIRPWALRDG